jgi:pimeloyl-ACP methyl ester carboxylesterase
MIEKTSFTFNHATSPVYKFGQGPKQLLVLHGWGSSIKSWKPLLKQIPEQEFTSYFLELPGFGESKEPNKGWSVSDYLAFVKQFLHSQDLSPEYLLVHSFGGRIAIKWLSEKDQPFQKAIFLGAAGIKPKLSQFQKFSKAVAPHFKRFSKIKFVNPAYKLLKKLIYKLNGSGDYIKVKGVMKKTFLHVIEEDLTHLLDKIKVPVRLIWGENDSYTPLWMGNLMKMKIKNSEIIVIPEGKHGLHLQNQDVILHSVNEFLT